MTYYRYDGSVAAETSAPANSFYGSGAVETMTGTGASETLWGSDGDVLRGGAGDDTYYLQGNNISVSEAAGGGTDKIVTWANTNLANYANVENLEVGGDHTYGVGNSQDNIIAASGNGQQLYGGGGQDVLVGGSGADTFLIVKGTGNDAIDNFNPGQDTVRLSAGYTSFAEVQAHLSQTGGDTKLDLGGGNGVVFHNLAPSQLSASNFQLQLDTSKLGAMTFHDEFSGAPSIYNATYNPTGIWRPDYDWGAQGLGSYTLPTNNEQQIYTSPYFRDHPGDFSESGLVGNGDGTLSIWAKPSNNPELFGYHYTSGMLSSKESLDQTYGYFEMRAELPHDAGGWPAFWLLPTDRSWPPELDVMETLTRDANAAWTTAHSSTNGHTMDQGVAFVPDTADGFHTYGVLWTKTDLTWFVDGAQVFHSATPADMNKPMYMIANLALGGWGGDIDNNQLPAEMKVDYVRAYALADGSSTVAVDTAHTGGTSAPGTPATIPAIPDGTGSSSSDAPQALNAPDGGGSLQGGMGNDTLSGGANGSNHIRGGDGADQITGGAGFNDVNGNQGDDSITGKSLVGDWLLGGQGNDSISATQSSGHDTVNGNLGNDTVLGGSGGDILRGGQGDDLIVGGAGNDWLSGDRGNDTLTGGGGADVFHHFAGAGVSTITDFHLSEGDRIQLEPGTQYSVAQSGADVTVTLTGGGELILQHTQLSDLGSGWIV